MSTKKAISKISAEKVARASKAYTDSKLIGLGSSLSEAAFSGSASDVGVTSISGLSSTNVQDVLSELLDTIVAHDITVESGTPGSGFLSTTIIKKNGVAIGTINIPKDYVNSIVGFSSEDGNGNSGTFLKVNTSAVGDPASYDYIDVSNLIEYLTLGDQTGKAVQLVISNDHKLTGDIPTNAITLQMLSSSLQTSINSANASLQEADIVDVTDDEVEAWFADE